MVCSRCPEAPRHETQHRQTQGEYLCEKGWSLARIATIPPGTLLREGYVTAIQTPPHRSPLVLGNSWYGWIKFRNKRQDDQDEINHRDTSDFFVLLRTRPIEPSAPPVYFPAWVTPTYFQSLRSGIGIPLSRRRAMLGCSSRAIVCLAYRKRSKPSGRDVEWITLMATNCE